MSEEDIAVLEAEWLLLEAQAAAAESTQGGEEAVAEEELVAQVDDDLGDESWIPEWVEEPVDIPADEELAYEEPGSAEPGVEEPSWDDPEYWAEWEAWWEAYIAENPDWNAYPEEEIVWEEPELPEEEIALLPEEPQLPDEPCPEEGPQLPDEPCPYPTEEQPIWSGPCPDVAEGVIVLMPAVMPPDWEPLITIVPFNPDTPASGEVTPEWCGTPHWLPGEEEPELVLATPSDGSDCPPIVDVESLGDDYYDMSEAPAPDCVYIVEVV